ncbi:MAG: polyphosphate polymerase domain-containing protein [Pseudobutyrivibrio sp.]|nr:polyphosphate polymerase domain-containing protein [Pseudobutyrivibrio sp.]
MDFRHELKFQISAKDMTRIKYRLESLMEVDPHQGPEGYTIRSLYFDDFKATALKETLSGVDKRRKYRIRTYDGSLDLIHLEEKSKISGMTHKESWNLSLEECRDYMAAIPSAMIPVMQAKHMEPACIVEYDRFAFVEASGNVRITFDTDIRGSMRCEEFLEKDAAMTPILPKGEHILEVKFDEFLPSWILSAVDLNHLQQQTFSKYGRVRGALEGLGL